MTPPAPARPRSRRRRRLVRAAVGLLVVLLVGFGALNWLAARHAHAFTHYAPSGTAPPPKPEDLSAGDALALAFDGVRVPRPINHTTPAGIGLAYTSHKLDMGGGESVAVWQIDRPDARGAVVLAPGYGAARSSMLAEAAAFHRLGWAVFLVDFRGTGDSSGNTTTLGVREGIDFAATVWCAERRYPDRPVVAYGFSMGAAAVLRAARRHLTTPLAGVALEAPFDALLESVRGRFRATGLPTWPGAELLVFWGGREHEFDGFAHRPADDAVFVDCPARVLHGSADPRATPAMVARVFDQILGPKKLITVAGAGHEPLVRFDPATWEAEMAEFLAAIAKAYVPPRPYIRAGPDGRLVGPDGEPADPVDVMLRLRAGKKE